MRMLMDGEALPSDFICPCEGTHSGVSFTDVEFCQPRSSSALLFRMEIKQTEFAFV